jgi:hypothetical protein
MFPARVPRRVDVPSDLARMWWWIAIDWRVADLAAFDPGVSLVDISQILSLASTFRASD